MEAKLWIDSECDIYQMAQSPSLESQFADVGESGLTPDDRVAEEPQLGRDLARLGYCLLAKHYLHIPIRECLFRKRTANTDKTSFCPRSLPDSPEGIKISADRTRLRLERGPQPLTFLVTQADTLLHLRGCLTFFQTKTGKMPLPSKPR